MKKQMMVVLSCLLISLGALLYFSGCTGEGGLPEPGGSPSTEAPLSTTSPGAIPKGRIVLINNVESGDPGTSFTYELSYGAQVSRPDGATLTSGQMVDTGFALDPGEYSISEALLPNWKGPTVTIVDPTGDSTSVAGKTSVRLAPGETVTVTYVNRPVSYGRIVVGVKTDPESTADGFIIKFSYGAKIGYPDGILMRGGDEVDSGLVLSPGEQYTIDESVPGGWHISRIDVKVLSASGGTNSEITTIPAQDGHDVTVGIGEGETALVAFVNAQGPRALAIDQSNPATDGTSFGGARWPGSLYQSFTPSASNLAAVDLLLSIGVDTAGKETPSTISIRESDPLGKILGTSTATIAPQPLGAKVVVRFDFSTPIKTQPGGVYFIDWLTPGPKILSWMGNMGNPYLGGSLFGPSGLPDTSIDLVFTTYFWK